MEHGTEHLAQQILDAALNGDGSQFLRLKRERAELQDLIEAQDLANKCAALKQKIQDLEQERNEFRREKLAYEAASLLAVDAWHEAQEREQAALQHCADINAKLYLASARIGTIDDQRRAADRELSKLTSESGE
jgi:chromosome segregation ATPase